MYLDSAYIAKYYVNEIDSGAVRRLLVGRSDVCSSAWAIVEVTSVFHRHMREGALAPDHFQEISQAFAEHIDAGLWTFVPLSSALLRKTAALIQSLPPDVPLRAGDAIHLATALDIGETEIWTNDRRLLAAASYFRIAGRSV